MAWLLGRGNLMNKGLEMETEECVGRDNEGDKGLWDCELTL